MDDYESARKLGRKQVARAIAQGRYPYLPALDDMLVSSWAGRRSLGVMEIPLSMVAGTCTHGRQNLFSWGFMPLAEPGTEFAVKWETLLAAQLEEGMRDPIVVYEHLQRFYVQEGNKRVSVARHLGMPTISADITRVIPEPDDSDAYLLYEEFARFFDVAPVYGLTFSRPGSYARLAKLMGKNLDEPWDEDSVRQLKGSYARFSAAFAKSGIRADELTPADAFLAYLQIFPGDSPAISDKEMGRRIAQIRDELAVASQDEPIAFSNEVPAEPKGVMPALKTAATTLKEGIVGAKPLQVSFIYDKTPQESGWVALHEQGRLQLEGSMGKRVSTQVHAGCSTDELFEQAVARSEDADLVVTVSPRQFEQTVRASVAHPRLPMINCSINLQSRSVRTFYARMYEVKFVLGVLAAGFSRSRQIGYVAVSPVYGAVSEVNAFALGVSMVDPEARVHLKWVSEGADAWREELADQGADVLVGMDYPDPTGVYSPHGLQRIFEDGSTELLAEAVWDWGRYYELIVNAIHSGAWKQDGKAVGAHARNYWLGMREGVVRLELADAVGEGPRRLAGILVRDIIEGRLKPFEGMQLGQGSAADGKGGTADLPDESIATMRQLASNIVGALPRQEVLTQDGLRAVAASGLTPDDVNAGLK